MRADPMNICDVRCRMAQCGPRVGRAASLLAALWCAAPALASASADQDRVDPPHDVRVKSVHGRLVTVEWQGPTSTTPPDQYRLEGGLRPGETVGALMIEGSATDATVILPAGEYFARVRAVSDGVASEPSEEVRVTVGALRPPSAPVDFAALAIGSDVALSWRNTFSGGAVEEAVVQVQGPMSGTWRVPASTPWTLGNVPNGRYVVTVRTRNASGDSPQTPPLTVTLPGAGLRVVHASAQRPGDAGLAVRYEDFTAPRLAEFAEREGLDKVVRGVASEFEGILRVRNWVVSQWLFGNPSPYPPWDAMTILDWIRGGYTGGFCGQYSQVFLQALASFGVPARFVEVGTTINAFAHFTTEVWSNDFNKWVLMDATFNAHFERDGVPQSALEIHDAFVAGTHGELVVKADAVADGQPNVNDFAERSAELLYYLRYHLKANHVSVPDEDPFDRFHDMIEWRDPETVPWEANPVETTLPKGRPTQDETADRALVDWRPNQVWLAPRRVGPMQFAIDIQHSVMAPSHVEFRVIGATGTPGPWTVHPGTTLIWKAAPTDRRLEVRGVNVMGRQGPAAAVELPPR